ncbi:MAG: DUF3592 domain-containing protein [Pseudomonadota bacterium]
MEWLGQAFDIIYTSFFAELSAMGFLFGLAIFAVGLLITVLFVASRVSGFRTTGTVLGAIEVSRLKIRDRDGERTRKITKSLFPVYEYQDSGGEVKQTAGSEGGTFTKRYRTGQAVNLIVREGDDRNDVYDADARTMLYLGLGCLTTGGLVMASVGSFAAAIGASVVSVLIALLVRALIVFVEDLSNRKSGSKLIDTSRRASLDKSFTPDDLKPIEHFQ